MSHASRTILAAGLFACLSFQASHAIDWTVTPTGTTLRGTSTSSSTKSIGINLPGLNDWNRSLMFADMMKQSRAWGTPAAAWVALPASALDEQGWPRQDAAVVVSTIGGPSVNEPNAPYVPPGVYNLSFQGTAVVTPQASPNVTVRNMQFDPATNTSEAEVVVASNAPQLFLKFANTVGGVKNVKLLRPGYKGTGKVFSDEFIALLSPFSTLRAMDYLSTNNNPVVNWVERTTINSATQGGVKGGSWEHLVELANLTGKDLWINIPQGANDQYVLELAKFLKANLGSNRKIYVEYSNELWNYVFPQAKANLNTAVAEVIAGNTTYTDLKACTTEDFAASTGACNSYTVATKRVAARSVQISRLFSQIFGYGAINNTVLPVYAGQYANPWGLQTGLDYIRKYHGAPSSFLHGIATAPYYSLGSLSTSTTLTMPQIFSAFDSYLKNSSYPMFSVGMYNASWSYVRGQVYDGSLSRTASPLALAKYYGIKSLAYEGGPDYGQNTNALALKNQSNFDSQMGNQLSSYLMNWYGCGNDMFVYFSMVGAYGRYGYWGLTNDITKQQTTKINAIKLVSQQLNSASSCQ